MSLIILSPTSTLSASNQLAVALSTAPPDPGSFGALTNGLRVTSKLRSAHRLVVGVILVDGSYVAWLAVTVSDAACVRYACRASSS